MNFLSGIGLIIVQTLSGLLLGVVVLRVLLPLSGARFRNPICQLIYQLTNPLLVPMTRLLPNWRGLSVAGVVLAWLLAVMLNALILLLLGSALTLPLTLWLGTTTLIQFVIGLYFWTIIIYALLSFFSPDPRHPVVELLAVLATPVLRPFRRLPPQLPGIDLSPLWALLTLRLLQYTLAYIGLGSTLF